MKTFNTLTYRIIKLACKGDRVEVDWNGTYADLMRLFTEGDCRGRKCPHVAPRTASVFLFPSEANNGPIDRGLVFLPFLTAGCNPSLAHIPPPPPCVFPRAEFTSNETPKALHLLDKGVCKQYAKRVFRLWDKDQRIAYEGFDLSSVKDGDTIQVKNERKKKSKKIKLSRKRFTRRA